MPVPILKQGRYLIATVQAELSDREWNGFMEDLLHMVGEKRARGVVVDVAALDVLDSYATRVLRGIAHASRLRGADTVLVGIQPEVALAMVQLGLTKRLQGVSTALDLEQAMDILKELHDGDGSGGIA